MKQASPLNHGVEFPGSRIVGGDVVLPLHEYPFMVAVYIDVGIGQAFCGGSLIGECPRNSSSSSSPRWPTCGATGSTARELLHFQIAIGF